MKEHPALFNTAMIRAIREHRKRHTRRPMVPQPTHFVGGVPFHGGRPIRCPFGVVGDRLWVRERFVRTDHNGAVFFADFRDMHGDYWESIASNPKDVRWSPSIHMPRSLCRTLLEVKRVWFERVQDIPEEDALAEGFAGQEDFYISWNSIYGKRGLGWDANPWVWAAEFEEVKQ